MGITTALAQWVCVTAFQDLPAPVVDVSKAMMLNAAAVALAGAAQPESRAITQLLQEMRGNGKCTVIGMGVRTSPVYAALANGAMVRLLDFDDEITPRSVHPSSVVFPVVMALGEMNGCPGKDVLTAFALGCEVASKVSALLGEGLTPALGNTTTAPLLVEAVPWAGGIPANPRADTPWHPDGVAGVIGAAAAAGRLLGLSQEQLEQALGLAAGQAGGIIANQATPGEAFQCGRAAMNGLMAAFLAHRGFGGARHAIEAPGGLLDCYRRGDFRRARVPAGMVEAVLGLTASSNPRDEAAFIAGLGDPYDVVRPGVTLKVYPCHSASHTAIDATLQLLQQYRISSAQVAAARVSVTPAALQSLPFARPRTGGEARLSLGYAVAAALLHGQPLLESFTDAAVQDPRVREMLDRITVAADETPTPAIPRPSTVTLSLADGRNIRHRVEYARGQPELPLEPREVDAKFLYCTRYILPPDHIEGAIGQFRDLENVADITGLASILGG
jgi:2-methylcitrate dehydratase PrpD